MCNWNVKQAFTAAIALMLIGSAITAVVVPVSASGHVEPPPADETVEVDTNVEVWDRAFLTTRANTSDAAATIPNADWRVRNKDGDETNLNRDPIAVYEPDQTVSVKFDQSYANKGGVFSDNEVEIIAAHIEESGQGSVPSSTSAAVDLLTQENANENASFESVGEKNITSGTLEFDFTPDQSGHYVLFLAREDGDGFVVDGQGNISVNSNATVVGMERLVVRKETGTVVPPNSVTRGESADFDVDATNVTGDNIKQAIVLYDENTYVTGSFIVNLQADLTSDFDIEANSVLNTTISDVNGVATVEEEVSAFGVNISDGTVSRTAGISSVADFISEEADADTPDTVVEPDSSVLDGSLTVVNRTGQATTVTVDTFQNWSTGDYRWAYVAVGDSSQEMVMDTGTVSVYERLSTVDAGSDRTVNTGNSVSFTASTSNSAQVAKYEWDWTSDGTYDATGETASTSYDSTGDYTVTLRVTDHSGVTYTDTATVTVNQPSSSPSPDPEPEPEPDPDISVSPGSLSFGDVSVGGSATETVTVSNTGGGTLDIDASVSGSSAFSASVDDTSVSSGGSSTVTVTFEPGAADTYSGDLQIESNDPDDGTTTVSLSGTGAEAEPSVSPSSIDFGEQFIYTQATEQITISNDGNAPLSVESLSLSGDTDQFSVGADSLTVAPDQSRTVDVNFSPVVADAASATLTVETPGESFDIGLSGTGVESDVGVAPLSSDFGGVVVGNQTDAEFTIQNSGDGPAQLGEVRLAGPGASAFELSEELNETELAAGASQTVTVAFAPERAGSYSARLQVTNASGVVIGEASLTGTGDAPRIRVQPSSLSFDDATVNETSQRSFSISNRGNATLTVTDLRFAGQQRGFSVDASAPLTLAPDESQEVDVTFTPQTPAVRSVNLLVQSNDRQNPRTPVFLTNTRAELNVTSTREANETQVNATVTNAEAGVSVPLSVAEEDTSTTDEVAVDEISLTPNRSGNFTTNIETSQSPPEDAPPFETDNGTEGLDYMDVNASIPNEDISQAQFTFRVNKSALEAGQSEPEDVKMYRAGETGWETRPTVFTNETDSAYVFRTNTSELSAWTVGAEQPQISVDSAEVNLTTATVDQTVNIRVSLVNTGGSDGVYTTELLINDSVVESESTTVPPNGSRLVTFERGFDDPGTYSVQVNDVFVGSVTINEEDENVTVTTPTTPSDTSDETDTTTSDDGGGGPLLPLAIIGVVIIAIAAVALWMREQ